MNLSAAYRIVGLLQGLFGIFAVLIAARAIQQHTGYGESNSGYWLLATAALLLVYGADRATDNRKAGKTIAKAWILLLPGMLMAPYGWWLARHGFDGLAYAMAAIALSLVSVYFFFIVRPAHGRLKFLREITAALVFAWVLISIPNRDAAAMPTLSVLFAGTCLSNLLVFSRLDYEKDARMGMQGLLHAPWFHSDMRTLLRAAYVWVLFLPPLLAFYLLAPPDMTQAWMYRTGSIYLGMVMVHWVLAEVHTGQRGASLFRLLADAALLCWLAL